MDSVAGKADRAKASFEGMWVDAINSDAIGYFYDMSYIFTTIIDKIGVFNIAVAGLIMVLQALYQQSALVDGKFANWVDTLTITGEKIKIQTALTNFYTNSIKGKTLAEQASAIATKVATIAQDGWNNKAKLGATISGLLSGGLKLAGGGLVTFAAFLKVASIEMVKFIALATVMNVLTGGVMAIIGGITSIFTGFKSGADSATMSVNELNKAIGQHSNNVKSLRSVSDEYDYFVRKMGETRDITRLSADEQDRYNGIMEQVEQIAPNYVAYIGEANTKMLIYGKTLDDIIEKEEELVRAKNKIWLIVKML